MKTRNSVGLPRTKEFFNDSCEWQQKLTNRKIEKVDWWKVKKFSPRKGGNLNFQVQILTRPKNFFEWKRRSSCFLWFFLTPGPEHPFFSDLFISSSCRWRLTFGTSPSIKFVYKPVILNQIFWLLQQNGSDDDDGPSSVRFSFWGSPPSLCFSSNMAKGLSKQERVTSGSFNFHVASGISFNRFIWRPSFRFRLRLSSLCFSPPSYIVCPSEVSVTCEIRNEGKICWTERA